MTRPPATLLLALLPLCAPARAAGLPGLPPEADSFSTQVRALEEEAAREAAESDPLLARLEELAARYEQGLDPAAATAARESLRPRLAQELETVSGLKRRARELLKIGRASCRERV